MKISFSILFNLAAVPIVSKFFIENIKGEENIPKDFNFILASNHCSNLDHFLIATALRKKLTKTSFIGKMEGFFQTCFFGPFYFITETIPLDRRNKGKRRILDKAIRYLNKNYAVVLYPEGTRNKSRKLREGKTGAAELSIRTGLPVVPFGISDIKNSRKKNLEFGRPIFPEKKIDSSLDLQKDYDLLRRATDKIMREIAGLCGKDY